MPGRVNGVVYGQWNATQVSPSCSALKAEPHCEPTAEATFPLADLNGFRRAALCFEVGCHDEGTDPRRNDAPDAGGARARAGLVSNRDRDVPTTARAAA